MAITTLIAACAILGSVSASAKHVKKDDVLTADIKTNATELTPQTINVPFDQQESPILLIYDNEFIIKVIPQERPSNGSNLLEIYRIGDNQPIYSAIPYGREEGQLYSAIPFIQGNTLLLQDGINEAVARVDLKSAVNDSSYTPEITKCEILTNYMMPYKDGIAYLSPYWTSDERITQKDKGDKFLFAGKELKKDSFTGKYQTTSITSGSLVANKRKNKILYFDATQDKVEVYDYSFNLIKTITGPDNIQPSFQFLEGQNNIALPKGEYIDAYLFGACASKNDVFAAYLGKADSEEMRTYIFHFTWDGTFVGSYYINGIVYGNLSASSDGKEIYASVLNESGEQQFNSYKIPDR